MCKIHFDKRKNIDKICYISPNTYAATANCILLNNLKVRFIDIDKSLNMSAEKLEEVLKKEKNKKQIYCYSHTFCW